MTYTKLSVIDWSGTRLTVVLRRRLRCTKPRASHRPASAAAALAAWAVALALALESRTALVASAAALMAAATDWATFSAADWSDGRAALADFCLLAHRPLRALEGRAADEGACSAITSATLARISFSSSARRVHVRDRPSTCLGVAQHRTWWLDLREGPWRVRATVATARAAQRKGSKVQ